MLKELKHFFFEYTYFSKSAQRAIWVLIILILLTLIAPTIYSKFVVKKSDILNKQQIEEYNKFLAELEKKEKTNYNIPSATFDPNLLSSNDWQQMGVPENIANRIVNYINKGGKIRNAEGLLKIHGFDTTLYVQIKPKIKVVTIENKRNTQPQKFIQKQIQIIDLNNTDSAQLERLPGIGPILASRIIKYKNLLGGYFSKKQLLEVYGITNDLYKRIENNITVNNRNILKININTATYGQLIRHPYIGKEKTKWIVKKRKEKLFENINELKDVFINKEKELENLLPYIEL
jgi:competence protein ComEA